MRVVITGSSGQIGTNLGLQLMDHGHEVFGVDKRLNAWTDRFRYLLQDLSGHYPAYPTGIGGVDYPPSDVVVHLAAHAKVHQLVRQPHRALENMMMTFNVLEYCRQTRTPIIFSSSREVYGDIHRFSTEETSADFAYTESTYSASKIAGEALIYSYARCYVLPYLVFRFSNVYGRFDNDIERMERVIPLFIRKISDDEPITIYGAEKVLDFTYIDDCVDGIVRGIEALVSGRVRNQTINLAFGQGNTLVRVAELIAAAANKAPRITLAPPLLGEVTHYIANISKAEQLLGYRPTTPLDKGIEKAIAWTQDWVAAHPPTAPAPARSQPEISEGFTAAGLGYKYSPQKVTPYPARERPVEAMDPEDDASH
jgi:UDP-glucose 4-epimerase